MAFNNYGSPATRYGLKAGLSIIAVDDIPTPNLDIFKKIVMKKTSNDSIKLNVVSWNGSHSVVTLKLNNKYWPSYEISQEENIWKRIVCFLAKLSLIIVNQVLPTPPFPEAIEIISFFGVSVSAIFSL